MAYTINKHYIRNDGTVAWRLVWEDYTQKKRRVRYIPKSEMTNLGMSPLLTIEEAREKVKQLNATNLLKRREKQRNSIQERLKEEDKLNRAYLPDMYVKQFEKDVLLRKLGRDGDNPELKVIQSHWRAAKRFIRGIKVEPSDWIEESDFIYNLFAKRKCSMSYVQKIFRIMNLWGAYVCRKSAKPFDPIKMPTGFYRERIADAYHDKGTTKESGPITPELLQKAKQTISEEHYRWLYISVWLGLRPNEIDNLKNIETWNLKIERGKKILWVYQSKLKSVPRDRRWKLIPILYSEQEAALEMINKQNFVRPLPKTIRHPLGDLLNAYGGRKGFTDFMLDRGHPLEAVSAWMSHTSIERTWRTYRNKWRARF